MENGDRGMMVDRRITTWWQRRTMPQKVAIVIVPTLLIGATIIAVLVATSFHGAENGQDICNDRCKAIADSLIKGMDATVDPCEDFYKFTCGNWVSSFAETLNSTVAFLPLEINVMMVLFEAIGSKLGVENLPSAQKKLRDVYVSCINNDIDEVLSQDLLEDVAGFPFCEMHWRESTYDLNVGIANAIRKFGVAPLLQFSVAPNWINTTKNVLAISAPENNELKFIEPNADEVLKFLAELFPKFCFERYLNHSEELQALGKNLEIIRENNKKIPPVKNFRLFTLKELETTFPGIDFIKIVNIVAYDYLKSVDKVIREEDEIGIFDYEYVKAFSTLVNSNTFSPSGFALYLGLKTLEKIFPVDVGAKFSGTIDKSETDSVKMQKSMFCLKSLSENLVYIIDRIYVDQVGATSESKAEKELEMIDSIRQAFLTLANESDWLDSTTYYGVKEKMHAMRTLVGYPSWILDDEKLNSYYSELPNMDSCYTNNIKRIVNFLMERELNKLDEVNDLETWKNYPDVTTTTVNAFYHPIYNLIYFPLGIQDKPFYYENMPWYLNFGAIGAVIGHEITHGFDSEGRHSDKNGNIYDWWSSQATLKFNARSKCFVDQYNSYFDQQTGLTVNGTQTLAENIADNGGIRQAYLAYQNWVKRYGKEETLPGLENYTPDQLLFIAYGKMWCANLDNDTMTNMMKIDEHCQVPYRVWGAVSNSKEFSEIFNCREGTKMNPKDKCVIW